MSHQIKKKIKLAKIKVEPTDPHPSDHHNEDQPHIKNETSDRCAICWLDPPTNAIRLDCGHIFCFLCIKSVAAATNRCALCRAEINADFDFDNFEVIGNVSLPKSSSDGCFWFYEGKTGWWLYDVDTNRELEEAHQKEKSQVEKLLSGQVYVINLKKMKQYQKSDPSRSRRICRESLALKNILGTAGLRDKRLIDLIKCHNQRFVVNPGIEDLRF